MKGLIKLFFSFSLLAMLTSLHAGTKAVSLYELDTLKNVGIKIIDIRLPNEISQTGTIPGAYRLNLYKKDGSINRANWLRRFTTLVKDRKVKFILVSKTGEEAKIGADLLYDQKGYRNPFYLEGGFNHWIEQDRPIQYIRKK